MLFTGLGQSVWEKTVPLVLSTAQGPVNNIYIYINLLLKWRMRKKQNN